MLACCVAFNIEVGYRRWSNICALCVYAAIKWEKLKVIDDWFAKWIWRTDTTHALRSHFSSQIENFLFYRPQIIFSSFFPSLALAFVLWSYSCENANKRYKKSPRKNPTTKTKSSRLLKIIWRFFCQSSQQKFIHLFRESIFSQPNGMWPVDMYSKSMLLSIGDVIGL